ncbi:MAG TPA: metal-dependent hydrolase [Vicinamibacterales bacterium]|nr:metal-dependent hydrolase [Vicinamibacterales bacterium]
MFIGHFAVGFAAKRVAPRLSLAALFAAAQLADVMWPVLVGLGIEQVRIDPGNTAFTPLDFVSYPYSHSLLFLSLWGVVFGLICARVIHDRRIVLIAAALVVSHWVLDWITHRPDMPLYPGSIKLGLGLWNSIPATIAVEVTMFAAAVWMYARATRARDASGRWAFAAFVGLLLVIYFANIGSPPPSITAVVIVGIAGTVVLMLWAWWFDRHRTALI